MNTDNFVGGESSKSLFNGAVRQKKIARKDAKNISREESNRSYRFLLFAAWRLCVKLLTEKEKHIARSWCMHAKQVLVEDGSFTIRVHPRNPWLNIGNTSAV